MDAVAFFLNDAAAPAPAPADRRRPVDRYLVSMGPHRLTARGVTLAAAVVDLTVTLANMNLELETPITFELIP